MLFFVMYIYGSVFCQGVTEYRFLEGDGGDEPHLPSQNETGTSAEPAMSEMYGSMARSFYTLFAAISQGMSWHLAYEPLREVSWMYAVGFLTYIVIVVFGVMNVVTSVFVESAILSAQRYRELIIQQKEHEREIAVEHMKEVFSQIDIDASGEITMEEMEFFLTEPALKSYVEALGISAENTRLLFRLMDCDGSGRIDLGEFCEGCLRLQGEARSVDVHTMIYQVKQFLTKWSEFTCYVEERLGHPDGHGPMDFASASSFFRGSRQSLGSR